MSDHRCGSLTTEIDFLFDLAQYPHSLSGLTPVQTVFKDYRQTTKVATSKERVNS